VAALDAAGEAWYVTPHRAPTGAPVFEKVTDMGVALAVKSDRSAIASRIPLLLASG